MGSSMDGGRPHRPRRHSWTPLRVWIWQNWPMLIISTFFGMYLLHWVISDRGTASDESNPRLRSSGMSRVKGGKILLSDVIAASLQLSEIAAHEIEDVKNGGREDSHVKGKTDEGVDEPVTQADGRSNSVFVNGLGHLFRRNRPSINIPNPPSPFPHLTSPVSHTYSVFVNGLRQLFPGINILSEETDSQPARLSLSLLNTVSLEQDPWLDLKDVLITVDPLDATKEFIENLLQYVTTMVCVVHKGVPIAGIINEVFTKDESTIWGVALPDGYKVVHGIQKAPDADNALENVVISRSHTGAGADVVTEFLPGKKPVFAGGSGYKSLRVLKGEADAYVHVTKIKSWDICAADAVVRSSGGKFTNLKGNELVYQKESPVFSEGIIAASSPTAHTWYVDHLATVSTASSGHHR